VGDIAPEVGDNAPDVGGITPDVGGVPWQTLGMLQFKTRHLAPFCFFRVRQSEN